MKRKSSSSNNEVAWWSNIISHCVTSEEKRKHVEILQCEVRFFFCYHSYNPSVLMYMNAITFEDVIKLAGLIIVWHNLFKIDIYDDAMIQTYIMHN